MAATNEHILLSGTQLPLMEAFYSIQGEGYYQGSAAWFIRLGGCDVGCHWCDVKESWEAADHPVVAIQEMVQQAKASGTEIVVVTGGEPLMYNLDPLCTALHKAGLKTHLETSGAYPLTGEWDWICFSPKKFKAPLEAFYARADELKIIVYNRSDFDWAEQQAELLHDFCKLYLQPEWDKSEKIVPEVINYIKQHPRWQLSLQIHKYMQVP